MSATAINALVLDTVDSNLVASVVAAGAPTLGRDNTGGPNRLTPSSQDAGAGALFTQRVQQAMQSLNLTPTSQASTAQFSAVLYDLFRAMDSEGTPVPTGSASAATGGNPATADASTGAAATAGAAAAVSNASYKATDVVSALHAMIEDLSSSTGSTRAEIAQLRSDFSALVTGKSDQSNFMTSTLIQFLKALQENLPAWPPGVAAVGGAVDTRA